MSGSLNAQHPLKRFRRARSQCAFRRPRTRTKYAYDANGNVTSRNGSLIGWTSYNYPSGVGTSTESATFDYGPNHQRWRMIYSGPSGNETTFYATPMFEKVYAGGGGEYRSYIYAGNRPVVVVMRNTASQIKVRSLLVDHQGSISSIVTDSTGASLVGESFTAYGNRREASTWSGAPTSGELTTMNGVTREGYTFQTVLGSMGLNHMNGRIEDSVTGRFLSPGPQEQLRATRKAGIDTVTSTTIRCHIPIRQDSMTATDHAPIAFRTIRLPHKTAGYSPVRGLLPLAIRHNTRDAAGQDVLIILAPVP